MALPTQGQTRLSPGDSSLPSLRSQKYFVKNRQSSVSAKQTREVVEVCLHLKDSSPLLRYVIFCLAISCWSHMSLKIFDILMTSTNFAVSHAQTQSPQKDSRSLISHLLHIAASPPDNAQRPHWNILQHLDSVNWDSIPAELKKVSRCHVLAIVCNKDEHLTEKDQPELD